jgi:serine/threonine-protein kinase ULK/ATG1
MKINAGSPLYMSPEALKSLEFSFDSDIFAVGVIMFEMLTGRTPWSAIS